MTFGVVVLMLSPCLGAFVLALLAVVLLQVARDHRRLGRVRRGVGVGARPSNL